MNYLKLAVHAINGFFAALCNQPVSAIALAVILLFGYLMAIAVNTAEFAGLLGLVIIAALLVLWIVSRHVSNKSDK
ncbi:hypothetical protein [Acidovorax sp. CF316]|uniref:hypothetical protein n=1 Tax=Acidovorax sp. CF316 TaxID=1144317 RepID=UPI0011B20A0E|nr:hypothetical protein [Acidovorax sp. CF316]